METRIVWPDGCEVQTGQIVSTDSQVDRFVIDVASMGGVSVDQIKALIEQRHEVKNITHDSKTIVAASFSG